MKRATTTKTDTRESAAVLMFPGATQARALKDLVEQKNRSGPVLVQDLKREAGIGKDLLARVEANFPGDPLRQINLFFENFAIRAATGRSRISSANTNRTYKMRMRGALKTLKALNMRVQNLSELSRKHAIAITRQMVEENASSSALANTNTVLRRFYTWIGKPDSVPSLPVIMEELAADPEIARRRITAVEPKTLSSQGVDPQQVVADMAAICQVGAMQLRLMLAFGLRVQEVICLNPVRADKGSFLLITDGTKGGRPREVPVATAEQRQLVDEAKIMASRDPKNLLRYRSSLQLHQAKNRLYAHFRKIGLTKAALGATGHGMRHEYASRRYEQLTGQKPPAEGGRGVDPKLDREVRQRIVEELGHSDVYKTSAYLGSVHSIDRHKQRNLQRLLEAVRADADLQADVKAAGITAMWVLGPAAQGETPTGTVIVAYEAPAPIADVELHKRIAYRLSALMHCLCHLQPKGDPALAAWPTFEIV